MKQIFNPFRKILLFFFLLLISFCSLPNPSNSMKLFVPLTSIVSSPTISVSVNRSTLANGGSFDMGSLNLGSTGTEISFTISNSGGSDLILSSSPVISNTGTNSSSFTLNQTSLPSSISAGHTDIFSVSLTPKSVGALSTTLTISSNDSTNPNFTINLTGTGLDQPSMSLTYNGTSLANGASLNFGSILKSQTSSSATITISNSGSMDLIITGGVSAITTSGTGSNDFIVNTLSTSATIVSGGTTTFTVSFSPTTTSTYSVTLSIPNNDETKNPFTLILTGTGVTPDINIKGNGTTIANGGTYDFGSVYNGGSSSDITFTIENTGTGSLTLTSSTLGGTNPTNFTITGNFTTPIAAGSSSSITIKFSPNSITTFNATLTVQNSDITNGNYVINLTGTGTTAPSISLLQSTTSISSGGIFYLGNYVALTAQVITFTIKNTGGTVLTISSMSGSTTEFSFSTLNTTVAASNGTTTFDITFTPQSMGVRTGSITIVSDDPNTPSFTVTLKGTGLEDATATCGVAGPSGDRMLVMTDPATLFDGNLSGVSGADSKCAVDANVTIYSGTTFKALIGATTRNKTTNWVLLANTRYFNAAGNCIFRTDNSGVPSFNFHESVYSTSSINVHTGFNSDFSASTNTCSDWTSNSTSSTGNFGKSNETDSTSMSNSSPPGLLKCDKTRAIYCAQQ
ncbi:MAG: choice-of-anchor D domain-containing protein [Leptospiraceae bacterium]|nr:choice-of-anchor D domain-containing protein [Leptospiraceae bacterium]MCP5512360.1 choice-of-anchor D domain-containing protein [Leptospiraceae bacterium]